MLRTAIATLLVVLAACSSGSTPPPLPHCYNTFASPPFTCSADWTGIDETTSTGSEGSTTTAPHCQCEAETACFVVASGVVACALTAK